MKLVGVCGLHHIAPARPRALHLQEILLTGCSWPTLRLPGSETLLREASRPGPLSLLNPACALISCLFAPHCPTSPKHPTWLDTGTLPWLRFLLRSLPPDSLGTLPYQIRSVYPTFQLLFVTNLFDLLAEPRLGGVAGFVCFAHGCVLRNLQSAQHSASHDMERRHVALRYG